MYPALCWKGDGVGIASEKKMPKVPEKACLGSDHHLNERNKREEKEKLYTKGGST